METQPASSASSAKLMSLGGIYKFGKWAQAKHYAKGLRLAEDNARAAFNHAWQMAAQATGIKGPQGGNAMPEDDTAYIDSPVTNHHHHTVKESSIGKLLLGAGLLATGIGAPIGAAILMSGAKDVVTPVIEKPVEKPPERPAVNIGGYELRLGK